MRLIFSQRNRGKHSRLVAKHKNNQKMYSNIIKKYWTKLNIVVRIIKAEVCVRVFETTMTMPQTKDLMGSMRKSNHPVMLLGAIFDARRPHEIYLFMYYQNASPQH